MEAPALAAPDFVSAQNDVHAHICSRTGSAHYGYPNFGGNDFHYCGTSGNGISTHTCFDHAISAIDQAVSE